MKKLTALILVLLMVMSLGVMAYADDGTQTTTVTVNVPAGTYTAMVPEDISFNLNTVTAATATSDGYNDDNCIGVATVSNVENCKYIFCGVTAPTLVKDSVTLPSRVVTRSCSVAPITIRFETINNGDYKSYAVYDQGRGKVEPGAGEGIYGVKLWLQIDEADGAIVAAGDYVGTMTFYFFYARHVGS